MDNDFKPDLGSRFEKQFGKVHNHTFYEVSIFDIIHVDTKLYSTTSYPTIDGKQFAATFDFSEDKLRKLLEQIKNDEFKNYLEEILLREFTGPKKADFTRTPILVDIKAKLGEPVQSQHEIFIPFIVDDFGNVEFESN